jgi:hypothetical protein
MAENRTQPARRFTLSEDQARNWLRHAAADYMANIYGEEPPADLEGPKPEGELPEIYDEWNPGAPGNESDVYQLGRGAVDAGIIGTPEGSALDLDSAYADDSDGGYYYFLVWLNDRVSLATLAQEIRHLGERDATGVTAALAILVEAHRSANDALDALDEYAAGRALDEQDAVGAGQPVSAQAPVPGLAAETARPAESRAGR